MSLALKYRPKKFNEVIGQETIVQTLSLALDKKQLADAYLFSGLRGSGKTSIARIFAKSLQCDQGETSTPCEVCENCIMANENRHIDIIEMDGASNRKIDDIRDLIEHTKYQPSVGRYKIFIIDEVHMLTNEAFNALLKTLEEPPKYVKFILATTDPLKLPATILSRTQHFRFYKIPESLIISHIQQICIKENVKYEELALNLISRSGQGSMRDTITLLEQAIVYSKNSITLAKTVEMLGVVNPETINNLFQLILNNKKDDIRVATKELINYDINSILDEIISHLKNAIFNNSISLITIERFFKIVADTKMFIKEDLDSEFALTLMFFKMVEATKPQKIDDLIKEYEAKTNLNTDRNLTSNQSKVIIQNSPISQNSVETPTSLFEKLTQKIYDRDAELGECFKNSVEFVSFENSILTWKSCPTKECLAKFKEYFTNVIRFLVNEIFGLDTKIVPIQCEKKTKKLAKKSYSVIDSITPEQKLFTKIHEIFGGHVDIIKTIE